MGASSGPGDAQEIRKLMINQPDSPALQVAAGNA
jgi:hypothetical protein